MRVVFAGTPPFAARALEAIAREHEVVLVLTQPDRPSGRGLRPAASAVAQTAATLGLEVAKPATLRNEESLARLRGAACEVMVVAAYGLILPRAVLDVPPLGCINIHASLLPRWRGAAPIHRAILAGDAEAGISIMRMDEGLDTGPVLAVHRLAVAPRETTGTLTERLAVLGAEAVVQALSGLRSLQARPQDDAAATYAAKVTKAEASLDWSQDSLALDRKVRALDPAPGAESRWAGGPLKIWAAEPDHGEGEPGTVLEASKDALRVACGRGALRITRLQKPGGRRLAAAQFLQGTPMAVGERLG